MPPFCTPPSLFRGPGCGKEAAKAASPTPKGAKRDLETDDSCPLAKRVPKAVKTGDPSEDIRREGERDAFIDILNKLWWDRTKIMPTQAFLRKLEKNELTQNSGAFSPAPELAGKIPKTWMAKFISTLSMGKITPAMLDTADVKDGELIPNLFSMLLQIPLNYKMPPALLNKSFCHRFCTNRAKEVGNRVAKVAEGFQDNGNYQCTTHGCYAIIFKDGRATHITHVSGTIVELPDHVVIADKFAMVNSFSDAHCRVELAPCKFVLQDCFNSGEGPKQHALADQKGLAALVAAEHKQAKTGAEQQGQEAEVQADSFLQESTQKKTAAMADKARAVLKVHRKEIQKKRSIVLA